ncbi:MAG: MmcQ/YjbR family DNA-binding protein [Armatimonadetes bacterium]|nr:MmcQ/YjbR family DNA-binding protein [Armatimonadota bacterium]
MDPLAEKVLTETRKAALALPLVTEKLSHGEPTWFVDGKKSFAMFCTYHHGMRLGIWMAAPPGAQEMLIQSDGEKFYRPPYVGPRGWVGVNLDGEVDWDELADLLKEAYRAVGPPKYLKMLEETP